MTNNEDNNENKKSLFDKIGIDELEMFKALKHDIKARINNNIIKNFIYIFVSVVVALFSLVGIFIYSIGIMSNEVVFLNMIGIVINYYIGYDFFKKAIKYFNFIKHEFKLKENINRCKTLKDISNIKELGIKIVKIDNKEH